MMGGQFQAEGEEQFCYSSLKSTISAPKTSEIILDESKPSTKSITPTLNTPTQQLPPITPNLPLTPLPPTPSPVINIPRSCGASRVLNAGGLSTHSPACTSNFLARKNPQYSGIGNTDLWIPFPTSQSSAKTGGALSDDMSADQVKEEQEETYLVPSEEPNLHSQAMSCPYVSFWEDAEAHKLSQITKLRTCKLVPLPPGHSAIGSK